MAKEDYRNPCDDCPYRWKDEDDNWPTCHWYEEFAGDKAPCEYDDYDDDDEEVPE